jgi:hypothetical protein
MANSFNKKLNDSEVRWSFIRIPRQHRHLFPEGKVFEINYRGKPFRVSINKAERIVSSKLFQELKAHTGSVITITKKSRNKFTITLK